MGSSQKFVAGMCGVIEKRARLYHDRERLLARIRAKRHGFLVQVRQQRIRPIEVQPSFELLEQLAQCRVRARWALEGIGCPGGHRGRA